VQLLCDGAFWPVTPGISTHAQVAALLRACASPDYASEPCFSEAV
jgi:hypothetical protein